MAGMESIANGVGATETGGRHADRHRDPQPHRVLREKLGQRGMTIRAVVRAAKTVSDQDTTGTYHEITRSLLWDMLQPGYIGANKPSAATINTLIMVLWDGDWRGFDRAMNFQAPHTLRNSNDDIRAPTASVPHYLEGEAPLKQRQRRGTPTTTATDFLLTVGAPVLAPHVLAEATLHCRRLTPDDGPEGYAGRIVILQDADGALHAAWHLGSHSLQRNGTSYDPPPGSDIIAVAELMAASIQARSQEPTVHLDLSHDPDDAHQAPKVTLTIPAPPNIRDQLRHLARQHHTTQRHVFEQALLDMLNAAEHEPNTIPPDHHLERPRDDGSYPMLSHLINQQTRDRLDQLAQHIGTQRHRRVYMKELALHALKRALTRNHPKTTPHNNPACR